MHVTKAIGSTDPLSFAFVAATTYCDLLFNSGINKEIKYFGKSATVSAALYSSSLTWSCTNSSWPKKDIRVLPCERLQVGFGLGP